jgi:hypothetical protein
MKIARREPPTPSCTTVRNLMDGAARHPLLDKAQPGNMVTLYGLEHNYHSGDYTETQNTVIFVTT